MFADTLTRRLSPLNQKESTLSDDSVRDYELVQHIAAKKKAALCDLYGIYGQRLYSYALRLTGLPSEAEDIVQETLLVVWQTAGRFRGEGRVLAWLLGIVHHTAMKALRHPSQPITEDREASLEAPIPTPEEAIQETERSLWLHRGLQTLSAEHRAVLELVFYQGLDLREVAEVCGCPVGTIKSRLSYARKHLRGILTRMEES